MTYDAWKTRSPDDDLDRTPLQVFTCDACDGSGEIPFSYWGYEAGCGHGHTMYDAERCTKCGGFGEWLDDAEGDPPSRESDS